MKTVVAVLLFFAVALPLLTGCSPKTAGATTTETTIRFHFSRFEYDVIKVPLGVPVTFTLQNDDPIEHEWIIGTEAVHERHRTGTEPYHDEIPTEVTVPALTTKATTVTFGAPGQYAFVCHLPGHENYGMRGTLVVVE